MVEKPGSTDPLSAAEGASFAASDLAFAELWDTFRRLKSGANGADGVLGKVDPVVFLIRRRILEDCLKGLLLRSTHLRSLSMDHKKLLAKRLSNAVWKGYLLAMADAELNGPAISSRAMMDYNYLWSVFTGLMKGFETSSGTVPELEAPVARALAEIQQRETDKLQEAMGAAGMGAVVGPQGEEKLLFASVGGLVLQGFLILKAQRKAMGAG
jgi:hypothetical protein